ERIMARKLRPIAPGEILLEEYMKPLGLSQNKVARDLDVPAARINDIVRGKRSISTDTALRLSIYLGTSPEFWVNLQSRYDLKIARRKLLPKIERGVRPFERRVA